MSEHNSPKKEPPTGNLPQPPPYPTPYYQNTPAPQQQFPTIPYNQPPAFKGPPAYAQQQVIGNPPPYYYAPHGPPPPPQYYSQQPHSYQFKVAPPPPHYYANDYRSVPSTKSDPNPSLSMSILVFSVFSEIFLVLGIFIGIERRLKAGSFLFAFIGFVYYVLSIIFARKTNRAMAIALAVSGILLCVIEFIGTIIMYRETEKVPSFLFAACVLGIAYSVKAAKLKKF